MRGRGAGAAIKVIRRCAGDEEIVTRATSDVLDIRIGVALRIAADTGRAWIQQIDGQVGCVARIADTVMQTATTIKIIRGRAGDESVVTRTTGQILNIYIGIALGIAANTGRAWGQQINRQVSGIARIADAIMRSSGTHTTIKTIDRTIRNEQIITGTTDNVLYRSITITGGITVTTLARQQVNRHSEIGSRVADSVRA